MPRKSVQWFCDNKDLKRMSESERSRHALIRSRMGPCPLPMRRVYTALAGGVPAGLLVHPVAIAVKDVEPGFRQANADQHPRL
ncbi:hypothetical protein QE408_001544 [Agrobacterium larrymoorei]|uniref:Uncharacterized protein n=1 Tax=Agrobacterium larrymoorei TaxID=160699 RepID=A0ABU0UHK0_9HYPH|nr:hypothetical protein [Agrobacterium larrymoorei]